MPADVFISYSSNDQDRVVKLADRLRSSGVSIWVDESGISAATLWSKEIAGAIKACKVLVLMVTPNSVTSKNVVKEVSLAAEQNKQILPVVLEPTQIPEALEYHLAGIQHLDIAGMSVSDSAEEILPALKRLLGMEIEGANVAGHSVRLSRRRSSNIWTDWRLYAFVVVAIALTWFLKPIPLISDPPPSPPYYVEAVLAGDLPLNIRDGNTFALSQDGNHLIYVTGNSLDLTSSLRLYRLSDGVDKELPGTEGAYNPFFSPDGKFVGFVTTAAVKTMPLSGGEPRSVVSVAFSRGVTWGMGDCIVYAPNGISGLRKTSTTGDDSKDITFLEDGEGSHRWPQFLPDGRHVLFTAYKGAYQETGPGHIKVVDVVTGGPPRSVLAEGSFARYVKSGHLLYVNNEMLHAVPFDLEELKPTGSATQLFQVRRNFEGGAQYAVAKEAGTLVYLPRIRGVETNRRLVWSDEQGNISSISIDKQGEYSYPDLSPDDGSIAFALDGDIHVLNMQRGILRRLTTNDALDANPLWSPDGDWIVFGSSRGGNPGLWRRRTDWSSPAELVVELEKNVPFPTSFSSNGNIIVYGVPTDETGWDTWTYSMEENNAETKPLFNSKFNEGAATLSPDGRSIAYASDDGGRMDIYLSPFDLTGGVQLVSPEGGRRPHWSKNGGRLFYQNDGAIWSVLVTSEGEETKVDNPKRVIEIPPGAVPIQWDVASDDKRFLFLLDNAQEGDDAVTEEGPTTANIIFNWFTELNKLVPVGKE